MSKFFLNQNQINNNEILIQGDDVNHIKNVLRYKVGQALIVCNNDLHVNYECEIVEFLIDSIKCSIIKELDSNTESNIKITIFQGLPKADKMELVIQKGTELGISTFVPVSMKRSIVKLNEKDSLKKIDRWQKIAEVAGKQSGRDIIPQVENVISFKELLSRINDYDLMFLAYEDEHKLSIKELLQSFKLNEKYISDQEVNIAFIVGPEGGIAPEEVQMLLENNVKAVTLGKRILRTETVALAVASIIMYELEK